MSAGHAGDPRAGGDPPRRTDVEGQDDDEAVEKRDQSGVLNVGQSTPTANARKPTIAMSDHR
jgi:hypothetical protein